MNGRRNEIHGKEKRYGKGIAKNRGKGMNRKGKNYNPKQTDDEGNMERG